MSTSDENPFVAQPDWSAQVSVGGGAITAVNQAKDCTVVYTGLGVFTCTLGNNGIDAGHCETTVDFEAAAARCWRVTHTSATVKVITITDGANAAADPTRLGIRFRRTVG